MDGRSLSDGLHQALEAKEGLPITDENQTQASITIQNFFRMYPALSGMTGTAKTEEKEFNRVYNMEVISIPTNRPILREDKKDVVYITADAKYKAVCAEVMNIHKKERPILIGTMSILQSETVARYLDEANLPYQLLNAKSAEQEADLIALAGKKGKITIATNMAGRGTDILLEKGVHELGGLHVIGTERHESRRVDNQLKGRAGRQGDPGSSQFFLSLEDEMIQRYAGEDVEKLKKSLKIDENGLILNNKIYDLINRTQLICEGSHFSMREYNLKLDDVINDQRNVVYKLRNNLLNEEVNMIEIVIPMIKNTLTVIAKDHLLEGMLPEEWDFTRLVEDLKAVLSTEEIPALSANNVHSAEDLQELLKDTLTSYIERVNALESDADAQQVLRQISLHFLDSGWTSHLSAMQHLKEGIGLRQYQQEDPARLYQKEGFEIFLHTFSHFEKEVALYLARYITVPQNI